MVRVYVGIGSNLDDPRRHVDDAVQALDQLPQTRRRAVSPLYRSRPLGPAGQDDYINAVAELDTLLEPEELLDALKLLEQRHGRRPDAPRWSARPLDLDILVYGHVQRRDPYLTIPHAALAHRNFVLWPLYDVAPHLEIPGLGPLAALRERSAADGLECLEPHP